MNCNPLLPINDLPSIPVACTKKNKKLTSLKFDSSMVLSVGKLVSCSPESVAIDTDSISAWWSGINKSSNCWK